LNFISFAEFEIYFSHTKHRTNIENRSKNCSHPPIERYDKLFIVHHFYPPRCCIEFNLVARNFLSLTNFKREQVARKIEAATTTMLITLGSEKIRKSILLSWRALMEKVLIYASENS
jgi:hypothetical protein